MSALSCYDDYKQSASDPVIVRPDPELTALRAENAALKAAVELLIKDRDDRIQWGHNRIAEIIRLAEEREELRAELAEAKIDLSKPPQERAYCSGCSLPAELERVKELETPLCVWIYDKVDEFFSEELSDSIACEVLQPLGYFERAAYDPEKHGEIDIDPGDEIWVFTDKFMAARARKDSHAE